MPFLFDQARAVDPQAERWKQVDARVFAAADVNSAGWWQKLVKGNNGAVQSFAVAGASEPVGMDEAGAGSSGYG
eukprot:3336391-Prorocentrum_lima.AAC.1